MTLKEFVVKQGWAKGFAEVRRAVFSEHVYINDQLATSADIELKLGDTVWFGKHKVAEVKSNEL